MRSHAARTAVVAVVALAVGLAAVAPATGTPERPGTPGAPRLAAGKALPLPAGAFRVGTGFGVAGSRWASGRHTGQDFPATTGTPIVAAAAGMIERVGSAGAYGLLTVQRVDAHTSLFYAHQSGTGVKPGMFVKAGQPIGQVGSTGNSTGPHLHFEVHVDGLMIDPMLWLRGQPATGGIPEPGQPADAGLPAGLTAAGDALTAATSQLAAANGALAAATVGHEQAALAVNQAWAAGQDAGFIADAAHVALGRQARAAYTHAAAARILAEVDAFTTGPESLPGLNLGDYVTGRVDARDAAALSAAIDAAEAASTRADEALTRFQADETALAAAQAQAEAARAVYGQAAAGYNTAAAAAGYPAIPVTGTQTTIGPGGCPVSIDPRWVRDGINPASVHQLCVNAVLSAPTPAAAAAVLYAIGQLGAPYACGGAGRLDVGRFDCSTLVARAYREGAGLAFVPPDATTVSLTRPPPPWLTQVPDTAIRAGDLLFYAQPGTNGDGAAGHVVMALTPTIMIDTGACGDGVRIQHLETNPTWTRYEGAFRITAPAG